MFIDKVKITIKSGNGGNGAATFHREKFVQMGGPDGGDGGKGGAIIFECDEKQNSLIEFHYKKKFAAENGENGAARKCSGKAGQDLVIKVPLGTVIRDEESGRIIADIFSVSDRKVVLVGGRGGFGNIHFVSSVRRSPSFCQNGDVTKVRSVILELKTIADVGLVGLPNAGKSTLLSVITAAKPKIANYHFTTLSPNLGVVKFYDESFVVADIPGLIEGASGGAGLGHSFLKHIERTRMLVHVVDMSGYEGDPVQNYKTIMSELKNYSEELVTKPIVVACNKMDLEQSKQNLTKFKKQIKNVVFVEISALTHKGLDELLAEVTKKLAELPPVSRIEVEPFEYLPEDKSKYEIEQIEDGVFEITGPFVEFLGRNVSLDDIDSFNYFQRVLRDHNVVERLTEMGAEDGDLVIMGDVEFDFIQ